MRHRIKIPRDAATSFQCFACRKWRFSSVPEAIPAHVGMVEVQADSKDLKGARVGWECCDNFLCRRRAVFKAKKLGYQNVNIWKLP